MKRSAVKTLIASASLLAIGWACGPFFPDTVLNRPQAALEVPPVSYLGELYQVAGKRRPAAENRGQPGNTSFLGQIPLELEELRQIWSENEVDKGEIAERASHYEAVRTKLLTPVIDASRMDFSVNQSVAVVELPERPLGDEFPAVVSEYVEGARLLATGSADEAREIWNGILEKPLEERRLRSLWAAWMLAKTSQDLEECAKWYRRVEEEAKLGGTDVLNLRAGAKSWLGAMEKDHLLALHLYYDAFVDGKEDAAIDIRRATGFIASSKDPELLARAAADPLVRRLVNLDLHAMMDGPLPIESGLEGLASEESPWLAALRATGEGTTEEAARIGWMLYASGRFAEAEKWLELADPGEPLTLWLQAKFDLRGGDLEAASRHLSEAIKLETAKSGWKPENPSNDSMLWYAGSNTRESQRQARLLADAGIVALGREEYLSALELLREGGFWVDAAYLAERVISLDGLMKHVRNVAPQWEPLTEAQGGEREVLDPAASPMSARTYYPSGIGQNNRFRYLLARRLARVGRLKEAAEFMPPALQHLLGNYVALDKARRSGKFSGEKLAAITWRQALIHRYRGAELFSTEGAPDGAAYGWSFSALSFASARSHRGGWERDYENFRQHKASEEGSGKPVPAISSDELKRLSKTKLRNDIRFHYRFRATELAWQAGRALPANHPLLARLYNTAGQWIAVSNPQKADRFYQAMVRRCAKTKEGKAADEKRWFLPQLAELANMPALPEELKSAKAQ